MLGGGKVDCDSTDSRYRRPMRRKSWMVGELRKRYGWPVEEVTVIERKPNGHRTPVKHFFMAPDVIEAARAAGAAEWVASFWGAAAIRKASQTSQVELNSRECVSGGGANAR